MLGTSPYRANMKLALVASYQAIRRMMKLERHPSGVRREGARMAAVYRVGAVVEAPAVSMAAVAVSVVAAVDSTAV